MFLARARDHCRTFKGVSSAFLSRIYTCADINSASVGLANIIVANPLGYSYHASSAAPSPQHNRNTEMSIFPMKILYRLNLVLFTERFLSEGGGGCVIMPLPKKAS